MESTKNYGGNSTAPLANWSYPDPRLWMRFAEATERARLSVGAATEKGGDSGTSALLSRANDGLIPVGAMRSERILEPLGHPPEYQPFTPADGAAFTELLYAHYHTPPQPKRTVPFSVIYFNIAAGDFKFEIENGSPPFRATYSVWGMMFGRDAVEETFPVAENATQSKPEIDCPTSVDPSALITEFAAPQPDWLELWQGPLHFRATYDKGKFGPGHTFDRINQFGRESASARGRHAPVYSVRLDPDDGAQVIEWLIGGAGRQPPFQTERHYHGSIGPGLCRRLLTDTKVRDQQLSHLPTDQRQRAVGAYSIAVSMRDWAEREFYQAVYAGHCEIWARIGSKIAPFRPIPPDIFRAYEIQSWGYGIPGGAWAKMDGAEPLFSIRVAPSQSYSAQVIADNRKASGSKGGRPPEVDWDAMKQLAAAALRESPNIGRSKLADSLVSDYAEKVSNPAPVKRTIERKLAAWNMGTTKPVSS